MIRFRCRRRFVHRGQPFRPALLTAAGVEGEIDGDAVEPGAKGCIATKKIEPFERSDEGILGQVVREFSVATEPENQPVNPGA